MTPQEFERKLPAILTADVVGYPELRLWFSAQALRPGMTPSKIRSWNGLSRYIGTGYFLCASFCLYENRLRIPRFMEEIELMKSGVITAEKYVTDIFPLEKLNEAFDRATDYNENTEVIVGP